MGGAIYILFDRAGIEDKMGPGGSSWIRRRAEQAMKVGLLHAYRGVGVNPDKYLKHLRRAYGLHVTSFREMNTVPVRSKNWAVSQKHPQKAVSILPTFRAGRSGRCSVELAVKFERVRWSGRGQVESSIAPGWRRRG